MLRLRLQIASLVVLILTVNAGTVAAWAERFGAPYLFEKGSYMASLGNACCWILDAWAIVTIIFLIARRQTLGKMLRDQPMFVAFTLLASLLFMLSSNPILAGKFQWIRVLQPVVQLWLLAKLFHLKVVKAEEGSRAARLRPIMTMLASTMALLIILEGVFMFVAKSSLNDNSLASKVWFARHWQLNSWGYRDAETATNFNARGRKLLLIGDSFLTGHGIKDTSDRFSNRLQGKLGSTWRVYNHGQNGANVESEHMQVSSFSLDPELVVLCWFVNDIQGCGDPFDPATPKTSAIYLKPPWPISILHGSYLVNFIANLFPGTQRGNDYLDYLHRAYAHLETMNDFSRWLIRIEETARSKHSKFAVVLFPMLNGIQESAFAIAPMKELWKSRGIPFLDLTPIYQPFKPEQLTVNACDAHPNPFAHQLAADAIWEFLEHEHLLEKPTPSPAY